MNIRGLSKIAAGVLASCLSLLGFLYLSIAAIGTFSNGRSAAVAMGCALVAIAAPFFAFLFSPRLAKAIGVLVLAAFALGMLWLAFLPSNPASHPAYYQIGAIALVVLLCARIGLSVLGKRNWPST